MTSESKARLHGNKINHYIKGILGDGKNIRFWIDNWSGDVPLMLKWPRLFALESTKRCLVFDRLPAEGTDDNLRWSWSRSSFAQEELADMSEVSSFLAGIVTSDAKDSWRWTLEESGIFSTSYKKAALPQVSVDPESRMWRGGWIPAKCKIFIWRAFMDRIPTRQALARRNVAVDSESCAFCRVFSESMDHLFSGCETACAVWSWLSEWAKINLIFVFSFKDVLMLHKGASEDKRARVIIQGLIMVVCWCVWKARNNKIFSSGRGSVEEIIEEVKSLGFLWLKCRSKYRDSME
ncbi:putative reverse transcriptase zinc-binding domain-containing protein [Helianthus annuus]|nr:putative reverse transcriptase zinc-binding domain-containing protein [Helianthus annuus]